MTEQLRPNGESAIVSSEFMSGALALLSSASRSNHKFRPAVDAVQQAAAAAKEDDHSAAFELLQKEILAPLEDLIRKKMTQIVQDSIRGSLKDGFPKLVSETLKQRLNEEVIQDLCGKTLEGFFQERNQLQDQVERLSKEFATFSQVAARLSQQGSEEGLLSITAPGFSGRIREQSAVKAEIGRRVAEYFFTNQRRPAFVLASSAAVHFGQQLRRLPNATGTLFATNSIAFPLAVLNDRSPHEVWTWCGCNYDDQCGGWLPRVGDSQYFDALRQAFSSNSFTLTTAILTPRKVAVENGIHFARAESTKIARTLIESAPEVILMVTADRICRSLEESEQAGAFPAGGTWRELGKKVHIVVAGPRKDSEINNYCKSLMQQGLTVHVQLPESSVWQIYAE